MINWNFLVSIVALAVFIPTLAASVRRLHDIGKSGWFYLIGLVPLVGWIFLLIWFVTDSQPGENMYGPNPKEPKYDGGAFGGDGFGM